MRAWAVVLIVLAVSGWAASSWLYFCYGTLSVRYSELCRNYDELSKSYIGLENRYESLESEHELLNTRYKSLQEDYNNLSHRYSSLELKYSILQSNYNDLNSRHQRLEADYKSLWKDYIELNRSYRILAEEYEVLNVEYQTLRSDYTALASKYRSLSESYITLQQSYATLQLQYEELSVEFKEVSSAYRAVSSELETWRVLHIGTTLETYYDYVRANVFSILGLIPVAEERWYKFPSYYKLSVQFAAQMAAHDVGNCYWPNLKCESEYYEYTGEYSYKTASSILRYALNLANVNVRDSATVKIDKILRFISSIVHYEHRLIDHMWFPTETLTFRSGDCTSFSILASALFEMAGIKSAIGFFENANGDGHAMVLVRLESLDGYSYYYYSDLTGLGLTAGKWIIIEPQFRSLSEQEESQDSWIPQWKLIAAAEVPYGP
ncbi:MAG: hypothetical protein QXO15_05140 [Nitrososphaerota archaeon]